MKKIPLGWPQITTTVKARPLPLGLHVLHAISLQPHVWMWYPRHLNTPASYVIGLNLRFCDFVNTFEKKRRRNTEKGKDLHPFTGVPSNQLMNWCTQQLQPLCLNSRPSQSTQWVYPNYQCVSSLNHPNVHNECIPTAKDPLPIE